MFFVEKLATKDSQTYITILHFTPLVLLPPSSALYAYVVWRPVGVPISNA